MIHRACRSCHAPNAEPTSAEFQPDCAFCHEPRSTPPSLLELIPGGRMTLVVTVDGAAGSSSDEWQREIEAALEDEDVSLLAPDAPEAVRVHIEITTSAGTGTTPHGTTFESVRYDAAIRVRRAEVTVTGLPVTAPAAPDTSAIREDLIARLVPILAY